MEEQIPRELLTPPATPPPTGPKPPRPLTFYEVYDNWVKNKEVLHKGVDNFVWYYDIFGHKVEVD